MNADEAQRRSFVFGNCAIDNPRVTREMVDQVADALEVSPYLQRPRRTIEEAQRALDERDRTEPGWRRIWDYCRQRVPAHEVIQ